MIVTIVGLGLIGGSIAIDLKKRGFAKTIIGVDNDKLHAHTAENIGIVDEIASFEDGIDKADLIVVAIPVGAAINVLPKILDRVDKQVVTDVCSTKGTIAERIKYHENRRNYVASHPMSGTESSGPWAAMSGLYDGKAAILCDCEDSDRTAIDVVRKMYETLNMRVLYMNSYNHDVHVAYVSHVSHIISYALANTVLKKEKNEKNIFDLASGGFGSTARLAKSSPEMWTPIFEHNAENVLSVLDTYIEQLNEFKEAIQNRDNDKVFELIKNANHIKKVLGGNPKK